MAGEVHFAVRVGGKKGSGRTILARSIFRWMQKTYELDGDEAEAAAKEEALSLAAHLIGDLGMGWSCTRY